MSDDSLVTFFPHSLPTHILKSYFPMGKFLGGTSAINHFIFNRGHPRDYDDWAKNTGDSTWSYKNVLKYFKKSENYHGDVQRAGTVST
jgi:choline dehydrogenase